MSYDKNADIPDDPMADFGYAWLARESDPLLFMVYEQYAEACGERCEDDPCDEGDDE